jgi:hypothetical protein
MAQRTAATVLEVLFATVVIVVGLLGIASLIPFAARDAQEANNHNQALSLGLGWADSFFARGLHIPIPDSSETQLRWTWLQDFPPVGSSRWSPYITSGVTGTYSQTGGNTGNVRRIWGHLPVCLDPMLMTSPSALVRINDGTAYGTREGSYRLSVFPYFNDRHDPAEDPLGAPTLTSDQPRMVRMSVGTINAAGAIIPSVRALVSNIFGSSDDQVDNSFIDPNAETVNASAANYDPRAARDDKDQLPADRLFSLGGANGNVPLKAQTQGRYTWMATIVPEEPLPEEISTAALATTYSSSPAKSGLLSLLILHRHSSEYIPVGSTDKPTGERITRVYPLSGNFVGGSGGRVRLVSNVNTDSELRVGDWIMLGRDYIRDANNLPYPFFRWYRIIGVDEGAQVGPLSSIRPAGVPEILGTPSIDVWGRDVVLEGPDFAFGEMGGLSTATHGTIVSGVITAIERKIRF